MKKTVVLLSGGLDSTVNLCQALEKTQVALALTFDYEQASAQKELSAARAICQRYKIPHKTLSLSWLGELSQSSLNCNDRTVPKNINLEDELQCSESAQSVWVANRNGVFLNIAAAYAEALSLGINCSWFQS